MAASSKATTPLSPSDVTSGVPATNSSVTVCLILLANNADPYKIDLVVTVRVVGVLLGCLLGGY